MDGRGGCCIARYAGNMYDMSKIDRIMMRYRPIAPKPDTKSSSARTAAADDSITRVKTGRGKRRYVRNSSSKKAGGVGNGGVTKRCRSKSGGTKIKPSSSEENESNGRSTISTGSVSGGDGIVTLPLLPETNPPPSREYPARGTFLTPRGVEKVPLWLNFGSGGSQVQGERAEMVARQPVSVVGTWVRVECITDTWVVGLDVYGGIGGCTDVEKMMNLERDTCPGFISDGGDRVIWVNKAYREMVVGQEEGEEEVMVWLVMKEGLQLPEKKWPGFTCRVRVVTCAKEKSSVTIPCDVWRLDSGQGFAWRLDTKAALSLGR